MKITEPCRYCIHLHNEKANHYYFCKSPKGAEDCCYPFYSGPVKIIRYRNEGANKYKMYYDKKDWHTIYEKGRKETEGYKKALQIALQMGLISKRDLDCIKKLIPCRD